ASSENAFILILPSGCAASTSRFTPPSGRLKIITAFIQSDITVLRRALATHLPPLSKCCARQLPRQFGGALPGLQSWNTLLPAAPPLGAVGDGVADGVNDIIRDEKVSV